jgi:hypothetical protein
MIMLGATDYALRLISYSRRRIRDYCNRLRACACGHDQDNNACKAANDDSRQAVNYRQLHRGYSKVT